MAAGAVTLYSTNKDDLNVNDLVGATVNLALVGSGYTPNTATGGHAVWADVSANEISATGGYTAGGVALASKVATAVSGGYKFSSAAPSWSASGANIPAWRYGVIYVVGSLWGATNPIVGYFLGDSTPADVPATADGNSLSITVPSGGWFDAA